jgi:hypothetical protein
VEQCIVGLRRVLADPGFAETIRDASGEPTGHV